MGAEHAHIKGREVGPLETDAFRVEPVCTRFAVKKKSQWVELAILRTRTTLTIES